MDRQMRRGAVVLAAAAAAVVLAVVAEAAGIELRSPAFDASGQWFRITLPLVVLTAAVPGLAGWALLAALERLTARAMRIWTGVAVATLAASFLMPLSGTGVSDAVRTVLLLEHIVVGGILIFGLRRTSRPRPAVAQIRRRAA